MPKRFTATDKWDEPWFCGLSDSDKLFWLYLLDKCDHAGIWQVNWSLVSFHIKGTVNPEAFKDKVVTLSAEKWFIPKFIAFQYGELNPNNQVHRSVISILEKAGAAQPLPSSCPGAMDKDKDKAKDKNKEKKAAISPFVLPDWVDAATWQAYKEMRVKARKSMTMAAMVMAIKKLSDLKEQGHDPKMVLEQSVFNSWQGLFPLKDTCPQKSGATPIPGKYDHISVRSGGENNGKH